MVDTMKTQKVNVKQAKRGQAASLVVDLGLLTLVMGRQLSVPGFQMGHLTGALLVLLLIVNLFVMADTGDSYGNVVRTVRDRLPVGIRLTIMMALMSALSAIYYVRTGLGEMTIILLVSTIVIVPAVFVVMAKQRARQANK